MRKERNRKKRICCLGVIIGLLFSVMGKYTVVLGAALYGEQNVSWDSVKIYLDGELLGKKAYYSDGVYMVSCEDLLDQEVDLKYAYNDTTGEITLESGNRVLKMQLGSLSAWYNQKEISLLQAPVALAKTDAGTKEVYVPLQNVAEVFAIELIVQNVNKENWNVRLQKPIVFTEEGEVHYYHGQKLRKVQYNDAWINLDVMFYGIQYGNTWMLPVKAVFEDEAIGGKVRIEGDTLYISRGDCEIQLQVGMDTMVVNGQEVKLPERIHKVKEDGDTHYLMPLESMFSAFGATIEDVDVEQGVVTVYKETTKYVDLHFDNMDSNTYIQAINGYSKKEQDWFEISCNKTPKIAVSSNETHIYVRLKNTKISQEYDGAVFDANHTKYMTVSQEESDVKVCITKESGVQFVSQYGNGKVRIYVGATPIKIAVDCGHGAYTVGKRTPPMPFNVDFDGDGIYEVKKGQSIREHTMNVGVGKILAAELERLGFKVVRSAFGSKDISLSARQSIIRKSGAKYSVSIHFNAAGSGRTFHSAKGVEVFYHSSYRKDSKKLARKVLRQMAKGTPQINRGTKKKNLALCNTKTMGTKASILVECAFMTNLHEAKNMCGSSAFWKETGEEIAKGICEYTNVAYIEP